MLCLAITSCDTDNSVYFCRTFIICNIFTRMTEMEQQESHQPRTMITSEPPPFYFSSFTARNLLRSSKWFGKVTKYLTASSQPAHNWWEDLCKSWVRARFAKWERDWEPTYHCSHHFHHCSLNIKGSPKSMGHLFASLSTNRSNKPKL